MRNTEYKTRTQESKRKKERKEKKKKKIFQPGMAFVFIVCYDIFDPRKK